MLVELDIPRSLFAEALEGMDADLAATTGNIRVDLSKDREDNVFARGDVKALVTVSCASCLGPALVKVSAPLKMTFVAGEEAEASDDPLDDVDVSSYDGETVDLGAIVREQIILGVPMSPKCRDNCAGLCATCGQNKNERDCGHKPPVLEDPRLAVLKNLKLEK
ncbi:MAG TPA: DUF177 domain-containing protein [Polyangia bacterium]|nr:DUF177 domain-containing protein [Polyangia bacterium]